MGVMNNYIKVGLKSPLPKHNDRLGEPGSGDFSPTKIYRGGNMSNTKELKEYLVGEDGFLLNKMHNGKTIMISGEWGSGNLKNMRRLYLAYPKSETASHQFTLSYSH
ncbi:MAG TPA: hypothetical protein ENK72_02730 [Epsilonproteobacteria bacterium]|nr:hypothetical protein [Campylobacterota bacterium]